MPPPPPKMTMCTNGAMVNTRKGDSGYCCKYAHIYSHGPRNRRGARINVPLRDRICEACGSGEVEDESHHTWKCSETWWPRLQLLASLSEVYPSIAYDLKSLPDGDSRTRTLYWTIPDGRYRGALAPGLAKIGTYHKAWHPVAQVSDGGAGSFDLPACHTPEPPKTPPRV